MSDASVKLATREAGVPYERDPVDVLAVALPIVPLMLGGAPTTLPAAFAGKASLGHTSVSDTDYQALSTDVQIGFTTLTAPRTVYLPDVDGYPMGQVLFVGDESGNCSETIPIIVSITPGSGDTIAGSTSHTLTSAYQGRGFRRGKANLWIFA